MNLCPTSWEHFVISADTQPEIFISDWNDGEPTMGKPDFKAFLPGQWFQFECNAMDVEQYVYAQLDKVTWYTENNTFMRKQPPLRTVVSEFFFDLYYRNIAGFWYNKLVGGNKGSGLGEDGPIMSNFWT